MNFSNIRFENHIKARCARMGVAGVVGIAGLTCSKTAVSWRAEKSRAEKSRYRNAGPIMKFRRAFPNSSAGGKENTVGSNHWFNVPILMLSHVRFTETIPSPLRRANKCMQFERRMELYSPAGNGVNIRRIGVSRDRPNAAAKPGAADMHAWTAIPRGGGLTSGSISRRPNRAAVRDA